MIHTKWHLTPPFCLCQPVKLTEKRETMSKLLRERVRDHFSSQTWLTLTGGTVLTYILRASKAGVLHAAVIGGQH